MRYRFSKLVAALAAVAISLFWGESVVQGQTLQIDYAAANWIEGFADFVRWEGEENAKKITVGIIGAPEVENYLKRRAQARSSMPRIEVKALTPEDSFEGVDIVYVGRSSKHRWQTIFSKCHGNKTLSISSQDGFVKAGGCVEFVVRRNRLRFYIAEENTDRSGVSISSKLLELAIESKNR